MAEEAVGGHSDNLDAVDRVHDKEEEREGEGAGGKEEGARLLKVAPAKLAYIPVVNIIYDLFFDSTPKFEQLEKALEALGVLGALVLAVVVALPTAVDYDELVAADMRYSNGTGYAEYWGSFDIAPPSEVLMVHIVRASSNLFVSLVSIILLYTIGVMADFPDDPKDSVSKEMKAWFLWARWPFLVAVFLLFGGVFSAGLALGTLFNVKFPDSYVEREGEAPLLKDEQATPYGYQETWGTVWLPVYLCLILLFVSVAQAAKYRAAGHGSVAPSSLTSGAQSSS